MAPRRRVKFARRPKVATCSAAKSRRVYDAFLCLKISEGSVDLLGPEASTGFQGDSWGHTPRTNQMKSLVEYALLDLGELTACCQACRSASALIISMPFSHRVDYPPSCMTS